MLYQMSFVNLLEHYILQILPTPTYNWNIFNLIIEQYGNQLNVNTLKEILQVNVGSSAAQYNLIIVDYYNKNMYEQLFYSENDKLIIFDWNGTNQNCFEILEDLSKKIIDLNDVISYQWFKIKFFVVKILVAVKNAIKYFDSRKNQTSNKYIKQVIK